MMKAVIFDLDGTLVDTLPVYMRAYTKVINRQFGISPAEESINSRFGLKATGILRGLLEDLDIDPEKADYGMLRDSVKEEMIENIEDIRVLPGALELLQKLEGDYKIALATSSRPYAAITFLKEFDMEKYFGAIVTGDQVDHSKPHPEIFLLAAKRLGISPEECLVVEDALYGVDAAKAAGMKVVAVSTGACSREELDGGDADAVIDSLEEFDFDILN